MSNFENDAREMILTSAQGIFARFGFKKTTMDEIAHAAHKAKSSIYHYFESKEEIFEEIVKKECRLLQEEITKAIKLEDAPQNKIRAYFITRMHTIYKVVNFYSAIKDEYLEQYSSIEKLRAEHDQEEIRIMKNILNE